MSNTKIGYLMASDNRIASVNMGDKTFDTPGAASGSGYEDAGLPYLYINLNNNQLTDIDLSKQKYLYWLEISGNRLTSLDLTGCSRVGGVLCGDNSLTSLVLDGCTRLWELRFANNGLSGELDLSPFSLTRIASEGNRLETDRRSAGLRSGRDLFHGRSRNAALLHEKRGNGLGQEIGNRDERPFMKKTFRPTTAGTVSILGIREHARIRAFLPAYQQNERRILSRITSWRETATTG